MKFDEIVGVVGEFGRIQKIVYLIICIPCISGGILMTLSVIALGVPKHRCKIPFLEDDTFEIKDAEHNLLVDKYIPTSSVDIEEYDKCSIYTYDQYDDHAYNTSTTNSSTGLIECNEWVYDQTDFTATVVTKLGLVCSESYKVPTAQSLFYGGVLIGALLSGVCSDKLGRKKTFTLSLAGMFASSFALVWVSAYSMYVVLRVLNGIFFSGSFLTAYVIGVEIVGISMRLYTGIVNQAFFASGMCFLAGVGYFVKDWFYIQIIISVPMGLFLTYWWLVPESPRWLINQKRYEEAEVIIRRAAHYNKVHLPDHVFNVNAMDEKEPQRPHEHLFTLLSNKKLLIRSLIIFYNWMVVSMVYYGLTLNSGNIGGNIFLNFFISGAVEFPAYVITLTLLDRLGRKKLHCISMLVGGVACLCTIFTILYGGRRLQTVTIILSMIGKLGSSAGFAIIYIFSAELFPTTVRNAGIGASSASARVGGMLAPQVAALGQKVGGGFGRALPLIIFGTISVIAGLLTLYLPETLNTLMPETIEDANDFGTSRYQRKAVHFNVQTEVLIQADANGTGEADKMNT